MFAALTTRSAATLTLPETRMPASPASMVLSGAIRSIVARRHFGNRVEGGDTGAGAGHLRRQADVAPGVVDAPRRGVHHGGLAAATGIDVTLRRPDLISPPKVVITRLWPSRMLSQGVGTDIANALGHHTGGGRRRLTFDTEYLLPTRAEQLDVATEVGVHAGTPYMTISPS